MGKTLRRYLVREILVGILAGLGLFTFILLIARLLDTVDLVMARGVPALQVLSLVAYILPSFLEIAIPISVLLGVVVAFGRLAGDGELLAMRAAGLSLWNLVPPVIAIGGTAAAITLFVTGWARPWALQRVEQTLYEIAKTRATAALRPAMFNAVTDGVVLYAENIDPAAGRLHGIMLSDERGNTRRTTVLAQDAELATDPASHDLFLRLTNGTSVTTHADRQDYDTTVFASLEVHLNAAAAANKSAASVPPPQLMYLGPLRTRAAVLGAQGNVASDESLELHRRIGFAAGTLLLGLLGIPLGAHPSRSVRARALTVSVGFALGYHVLVNAAATLARSGLVGPALAMWIPNAAILASALFMLARTAADRRPYPTALLRSLMMRGRTSR